MKKPGKAGKGSSSRAASSAAKKRASKSGAGASEKKAPKRGAASGAPSPAKKRGAKKGAASSAKTLPTRGATRRFSSDKTPKGRASATPATPALGRERAQPGGAARTQPSPPAARAAPSGLARAEGSLIDHLNAGGRAQAPSSAGESALARVSRMETLEEAYEAWLELKLEHAAVLARYAEERTRLEREGSFLLGAVRAAGHAGANASDSTALATTDALQGFVKEAEARLSRAREALEAEAASELARFDDAFAALKAELRARIERYAGKVKLSLRLLLRPIGQTRTILHVERISADEAALLLFVLSGAIATRYGFLVDDSTDDVNLPPQPLYPDEGLNASDTRPDANVLRALVERPNAVLPLKGFIPVFVPRTDGGVDFFRMLQRGPVLEVELQEGAQFRNVLSREEGERFAGHLLRKKLEGKLDLELQAG